MQSIFGIWGDCGSTKGVETVTDDKHKLLNRYAIVGGKSVLITSDNVNKFIGKKVVLRDPIYCRQKDGNYCSHCLGELAFKLERNKKIAVGLKSADAAMAILGMFMKQTHDLSAGVYRIKDLDEFVYPKKHKPLFSNRVDDLDGIEKVYCETDIEWRVPASSVTATEDVYSVLAHGSLLSSDGIDHSFVIGTEVFTNPSEIVAPDESMPELQRHIIFRYKKGDVFLTSVMTSRQEVTVYKMFNLFLGGNASNLIPFELHLTTLENTLKTNKKAKFKYNSLAVILSSLARDARDISKPARETGTTDYKFVSMYDLIVMSGMFNSAFGPDAVKSIMININKSFEEQTKNISPIEKALRY